MFGIPKLFFIKYLTTGCIVFVKNVKQTGEMYGSR